ncbi:cell surface protein SprA [Flavobacterium dankookense]|uniref:Protein involved in gliding motility SprA n=1 Tax=Flavobacterium dankookense TaxID=706186 RepID=A0A4V3CSG2_9FLAO|nr:cell surface protein SprA [Flavobacterium dankookense]TDP60272.1 protein involved in gliding motility SprA [Flavobacterium dankookense]
METNYFNTISSKLKKVFIGLAVLLSANVFSQEDEPVKDTIGYSTGRVEIKNPTSVVDLYTYDPITNRYIYTSTVDGFNINYPIILTPKEYEELVLRESMRDYFKKKSNAIDGKGTDADKKDLLPRYYVNSSFFETIFGSNTIDVKPTGSVEMDLGARYTKQDNPAFSPRNRAQTTFDFDQRISMSLMGKVGTRLNVNANYDTESTFAFQNLIKLEYSPTEDDIIQKIEVGNVSMPLTNSLIRGAQSLFGVKAQFQFGKTTITGVFSEQKSQTRSVTSQGGGTIQDFELFALDYDADRHFFLSQFFRSKYDQALANYPFIESRVQITRMEVWVTNRQNRVNGTNNNLRNIIALQDLGEAQLTGLPDDDVVAIAALDIPGFFLSPIDSPTANKNNKYDPANINQPGSFLNQNIREIVTTSQGFNNSVPVSEGTDYSKLENARKLNANEYTFHPQLGYISLQQRLANDEVLAVAYQYTIGDQVYQVGEFGTDGVESTVVSGTEADPNVSTQCLILKMLKSNLTNVKKPIWNLLMKNIYQIPGGYQLQQEDFRFNILYTDPSPLNYITQANTTSPLPADVEQTPLLKVFNIDKLNYNNDPQAGGDGFFDFMPGLTVDQQNGRLIFTTVEPFGKHLFEKLRTNATENYFENYEADQLPTTATFNANQAKYVFREMYRSTQAAALQDATRNKFQLKGRYKSAGGDGIPIGAFNVPRGSVVVTAGGRLLVEGVDYSVNYQAGRVQILDPSLQASNTPIEVSVENNSTFGQQTRRFMGINVEHKFSDKLMLGATFIKMTERPFTQKSNYGQESVNNTIFGFNANYSTEVPFLTRLANKLPNIDTDVPSNLSLRGEIAFLQPDTPKQDRFEGESTVYVDDFEGSQTTIDMRSPLSWSLSSVPIVDETPTTPIDYNFNANSLSLEYGHKRAKLNWYSIDPTIYVQTPNEIGQDGISLNSTRRIFNNELFPNQQIAVGQSQVINTLDLTYYPSERGPYNYNPSAASTGLLPNPQENFGGITRAINSTNFEQSNVEYIQFWIMDPYFDPTNPDAVSNPANTGKIYFNLGEISEDVLKDERKQYENGLPADNASQSLTNSTVWGKVPSAQSLIYAFDVDGAARSSQDVGFDGLNDAAESTLAGIDPAFASLPDPAADNYQYFLNASGSSIFDRYKNYNGVDGNSPIAVTDTNRGSTTLPDVEDINRDNTMNTINAYYEYSIKVSPADLAETNVGNNYITDYKLTENVNLPNGLTTSSRWLQFKIPVKEFENAVGGISDFRSIRFMRMFMTGFTQPITIRFGALDLVRGEWRRYDNSFEFTDNNPADDGTNFDVLSVNIQENAQRVPIPYVTPPGVVREQVNQNNTIISQNEQSLSLRASGDGLEAGDSRAVFKNVNIDMRQFNKLKMFLHAESLPGVTPELQEDQMAAFIRFGNDFTDNFYEVEIPLKVTTPVTGSGDPELIWPELNEIDLPTALLTKLKILAMGPSAPPEDDNGIRYANDFDLDPSLASNTSRGKLRIGIKGNPNFGLVRTLMVGIRNNTTLDGVKGEVWFNELRLADMSNKGGMAAVLNMDANMADFATLSATGRMSTIGFGALEEGPNERSREDIQQYNLVTNVSLGKLLPKKWGINLPFNYAVGEEIITPEYDPFNQDIRLQQLLDNTSDSAERDNIEKRAIDYTKRKSINFIGVKKERAPEQKQRIYDPENLTLSYSYNEIKKHNFEIENFIDQQVNTTVDYTYTFKPKTIEPFKNTKVFKKSDYWKLLREFNFNYLPTNISFSSNIIRQFNKQQFRQVEVGLPLDALYRRNYSFNYQYGFNYNLTKALKINYTAASQNIVRSYIDENNQPDNSYTVWTDFWNIGTPNQHNQQIVINYDLPINKIPLLAFVKPTYSYTGGYSWQRASLAFETVPLNGVEYNLGNTVQNSGAHRLNTAFNMETFYKYIGLGKKTPKANAPKPAAPKPGEKITNTKAQPVQSTNVFLDGLKGVLTSVKNVQINYTQNEGTVLPGFLPSLGFFGSSKPGIGFIFGSQDDVRYEAAKNGWLTDYPDFNQNYTQVVTKTLDMTANVDLFPDFKIDLTAKRAYADNYSEQYDAVGGVYESRSPYSFGNFEISTVMLKSAFKVSDENFSSAFNDFRGNRIFIADRLATQFYGNTSYSRDAEGYPIGFGKNSQAVLLPAFLAAYTGLYSTGANDSAKDISLSALRNIPIPNWTVKYTGLMRYKFFKDTFKRFSIQHAYRASYTLNSFRSNLEYDRTNPNKVDAGGNYQRQTIIGNANLVEQFNPLIRVDFEMKNSLKILAEMKKDRSLSLSFDNNLLTEVQGLEYILGFGYRIKDVIFSSQLADNPTGIIKSDINVKIDFSYRNSKTIVRYLDYDNNQLGGGQNLWSARLTADYSFSKNLTAIFFYDHSFSKPVISTSFPLTNIRAGFTMRYNFGN